MPELPTYTASGRISGGPVAAPIDPSTLTRPYEAIERVGAAIAHAGASIGQINERRKVETDLRWATESASQYDRELLERRVEDSKAPRETEGDEFRLFADDKVEEYSKAAPSQRARDTFRRHALAAANRGYEHALASGEKTRFVNADVANDKTVANIVASYKATESLDTADGAARDISPLVNLQLAYIETTFGKAAPAFAERMRLRVVSEVAIATAATNPEYARQLVESAPIDEATKLVIGNKIDAIQASAQEFEREKFWTAIQSSLSDATITGALVPPISDGAFKARFGENWKIPAFRYENDRTVVNSANAKHAGMAGFNPYAQSQAIADIVKDGTPQERKAVPVLIRQQEESARMAAADPAAWQQINDPDVREAQQMIATLPVDAQSEGRAHVARLMRSRQGHAPEGDPHPERYLGHDRVHIMSAAEADRRKIQINEASVDKTKTLLADLEAEFGDAELANHAYADMLDLGNEKLSVAFRFAGTIRNPQTQTEFIGAQKSAKGLKALDTEVEKDYLNALAGNKDWEQFARGWMGEKWERAGDVDDARTALLNYARALSPGNSPEKSMNLAVERVISENYGFAKVHGQSIPIGRQRLNGGPDRTDAEISDMSRGLQLALRDVPVKEILLNNPVDGQPLFVNLRPGADMSKPEDAQYVRDAITSNGYWVMEPHGEVVKLFVREPGRAGFAVLDKNRQPLQFKLDDLPKFSKLVPARPTGKAGPVGMTTVREYPLETYPLFEDATTTGERIGRFLNQWMYPVETTIRTNWPTRPAYMSPNTDGRNFKVD